MLAAVLEPFMMSNLGSCRSNGAYTKLLTPVQALLAKMNEFEEVGEEVFGLSLSSSLRFVRGTPCHRVFSRHGCRVWAPFRPHFFGGVR